MVPLVRGSESQGCLGLWSDHGMWHKVGSIPDGHWNGWGQEDWDGAGHLVTWGLHHEWWEKGGSCCLLEVGHSHLWKRRGKWRWVSVICWWRLSQWPFYHPNLQPWSMLPDWYGLGKWWMPLCLYTSTLLVCKHLAGRNFSDVSLIALCVGIKHLIFKFNSTNIYWAHTLPQALDHTLGTQQ